MITTAGLAKALAALVESSLYDQEGIDEHRGGRDVDELRRDGAIPKEILDAERLLSEWDVTQ